VSAPAVEAVELIGPKGYTHGWVYHGPGRGTRTHTSRLVSRTVRGARTQPGSIGQIADKATAGLRGKKASDYQHLAAARLHMAAARQEKGASARKAHHIQMAAMHRGIASRNVGRQTASEGPMRRPSNPNSPEKVRARANTGRVTQAALRSRANLSTAKARRLAGRKLRQRRGPAPAPFAPKKPQLAGPGLTMATELASVPHAETATGRKSAFKRGLAISPPSPGAPHGFPVTDPVHWDKARRAIGRVKSPARRAQVAALLRRTAARFGKTAALKESWAAPGGSKHSNEQAAIEMAERFPKYPVASPYDVLIVRGEDGSAIVRHRRGGYEIARIRHAGDGSWVAESGGRDLSPHTHQRAALMEAIGVHNRSSGTPYHRPEAPEPLQKPPVQTPLMAQFGIPAIKALANSAPVVGASDGPRETGGPTAGLGKRGAGIYTKLRKRGFPHERAHNFARRAENLAARRSK
jgi:hypothetical protein